LKAPGPDGFPARFFQRNWEIVGTDVIKGVKQFFESAHMPPGVNDTMIVLLPKKDEPELQGLSANIPMQCNLQSSF
jgi:hypothetical protein